MSIRTIVVVGLALTCGASAAVGVHQLRSTAAEEAKVETVPIVMSAINIPRGTTISEEMVFVREWPKDQVPEGVITSVEEAVDQTAVIPLLKGEPLIKQKLGEGRGVASIVKKGMRAFTIQTPNAASSVAGFILPGNKVDVLLTLSGGSRDASGGGVTTTLLQNVEVLAVDQQIEAPESNKVEQLRSVTLMVTEEQSKMLALAQNRGTLNLSLRNEGDDQMITSPPKTVNDIRYLQGQPNQSAGEESGGTRVAMRPPRQRLRLRIRTMRGIDSGQVILEQYPAVVEPKESSILDDLGKFLTNENE